MEIEDSPIIRTSGPKRPVNDRVTMKDNIPRFRYGRDGFRGFFFFSLGYALEKIFRSVIPTQMATRNYLETTVFFGALIQRDAGIKNRPAVNHNSILMPGHWTAVMRKFKDG